MVAYIDRISQSFVLLNILGRAHDAINPKENIMAMPLKDLKSEPTPRVLVALRESGSPSSCVLRARALALVMGAELEVVLVLPEQTRLNTLFPQHNLLDAMQSAELALQSSQTTRTWLRGLLGGDESAVRFALVHGNFVAEAARYAQDIGAQLIVVPECEDSCGSVATALARAAQIPVLVARSGSGREAIVAATDLETEGYPVLRWAADLGRRLEAPVVVVHNVNPEATNEEKARPLQVFKNDTRGVALLHLLETPAEDRSVDGLPSVLRADTDPVSAILSEAKAFDADMIVVGTREHGFLGRLFGVSVPAQVVDESSCSVFVLPID